MILEIMILKIVHIKKLLHESILVVLEKDDEDKIKVKSYNYFKIYFFLYLPSILNV